MTLNSVPIGKCVEIVCIQGHGILKKRLLEMGLTPCTRIQMKKKAPFGDPIEILVRHYTLTLRGKDAYQIIVKEE